jgi:hypothetical protein
MTLVISKGITLRKGWQPMDPDAAAYITAVETADTEPLEEKTKIAIDNFVLGCKADGIWNAIKASCILAGARTLTGALVPLAGAAPTNVGGLFVSGDYNRNTGLVGDGTTQHLDSNRNNNADPQDSKHVSVFPTSVPGSRNVITTVGTPSGATTYTTNSAGRGGVNSNFGPAGIGIMAANKLTGLSRSSGTTVNFRTNSISSTFLATSLTPGSGNLSIYGGGNLNCRLAFYSIGESLDLALLDARVTDLINAFAAAIP